MTTIRIERTPAGATIKGPDSIATTYGRGLREHALLHIHAGNLCEDHPDVVGQWEFSNAEARIKVAAFAALEARILGHFSGHDPRNHVGKYAFRRNFK